MSTKKTTKIDTKLRKPASDYLRSRSGGRAIVALCLLLAVFFGLATPAFAQGGEEGQGQIHFGQDFTLRAGERIAGDLALFGGSLVVEENASVAGDVFVAGGNAQVAGQIQGTLAVLGGSVHLDDGAVVRGDVSVFGGEFERSPGAQVLGNVTTGDTFTLPSLPSIGDARIPILPSFELPAQPEGRGSQVWNAVWRIAWGIFVSFALAALCLVILALFEKPVRQAQNTLLRTPWASLGMGFLTLIVVAAVSTILVLLICTIPLALLLILALGIASLFGLTVTGLTLAERVFQALRISPVSSLVAVLSGVLLIALLAHLPCLGWLVGLVAISFGLGTVVLTRAGTVVYPTPGAGLASGDSSFGAASATVSEPPADMAPADATSADETPATEPPPLLPPTTRGP